MHGLVNRSLQAFLRQSYGAALWQAAADAAGIGPDGFEPMLTYPDPLTLALAQAAADRLDKPRDALLEDMGGWLAAQEPLRRLLRFGGVDYPEFLKSLEDLPGRARLAVPDLALPDLRLTARDGRLAVHVAGPAPLVEVFAPLFAGLFRAMADDYGALAMIDLHRSRGGRRISVQILASGWSPGRRFDLAQPAGRG
ncbi:heme NO-binding domain-containing protein [Frigidibacter oleivorans]|uniref:heme NO-binding domain-containing protein n=1 Tax=Frigidibacter oleivorans TaxID=2487129 RepID=UPI000F8CA749|nr:heme NO-binding domain-containing protein [Frigidibacter oleivorans]